MQTPTQTHTLTRIQRQTWPNTISLHHRLFLQGNTVFTNFIFDECDWMTSPCHVAIQFPSVLSLLLPDLRLWFSWCRGHCSWLMGCITSQSIRLFSMYAILTNFLDASNTFFNTNTFFLAVVDQSFVWRTGEGLSEDTKNTILKTDV